ncbi:hypothetical protein C9374_013583 [Naegleria lovaniensis]|uniref:Calcineurin-like phosphoesterase domain-containing protein n=1 Tax=Naegleria lovaniensis TaxID=51637 RepID=A0AA88GZK9_NAELO|nr:uncharacterized protein C9374_013583 [Naegleria lovaniensis]KAG2392098.1 hypothetical protein C9374_013583 [Naegleria lovaniensis]
MKPNQSSLLPHAQQFCEWFSQQRLSLSKYMSSKEEQLMHAPQFCIVHVPMTFIEEFIQQFLLPLFNNQYQYETLKTQFCKTLHDELKINIVESSSDSQKPLQFKRFVVLSDSHCQEQALYPKIPNGDIVLHCGDFTDRGSFEEIQQFNSLLGTLKKNGKCKLTICISGNHDLMMDPKLNTQLNAEQIFNKKEHPLLPDCDYYLCNNSLILDGAIKIYGSPITPFQGFHAETKEAFQMWQRMDSDADIVMTHNPPYNILDLAWVSQGTKGRCSTCNREHPKGSHWGDFWLKHALIHRVKPTVACFGHVHDEPGYVRHSIEELVQQEDHQKQLFNIPSTNHYGNGVSSKTTSHNNITFLNAALDLTHRVYFFDYFYEPNSKVEFF